MNVVGASAIEETRVRRADAFVVFADDFSLEDILAFVEQGAGNRLGPRVVLVTALPTKLAERVGARDRSNEPIILARPAWGFSILDALRQERRRPNI